MSLPGALLCLLWPSLCVAAVVYLGLRFIRRIESIRDEALRCAHDAYDHAKASRAVVEKFNADEAPTVVLRPRRPVEQPHRLDMTRGERIRAQGADGPKHALRRPRKEP
jgi:hypothetical protein